MDHVSEFEKNVMNRIADLKIRENSPKRVSSHEFKASYLFIGIALGVLSSKVACLCQK